MSKMREITSNMKCICKICNKEFEANPFWHHKIGLCNNECRIKARKLSRIKYKKTEKGKQSYLRWCKNPIKKEIDKKYRQTPKAKRLAVMRAIKCLQNNPHLQERKRQRDKEFAKTERGRELNRKATSKYRVTINGKIAQKQYKYLLRNNIAGKINKLAWFNKVRDLDFQCQNCKKQLPPDDLTIDHIIPLSKGGTNYIDNLQPLCQSCNCSKGAKVLC